MTDDKILRFVIAHLNTHGSDNVNLKNIADLFDGEYWNSGGNYMLCSIPLQTDWQIVISDEMACLYYNPWRGQIGGHDFQFLENVNLPEGVETFPNVIIWRDS